VTAARRRVITYVEAKIRRIMLHADPTARTMTNGIHVALNEFIDDLIAVGNTRRQADLVKGRIERIITEAGFIEYSQLDSVQVTKAIAQLRAKEEFTTTVTANRYREAARAWSRWMALNGRWPENPLQYMAKFKGDVTPSRRRAILSDDQMTKLLTSVRREPARRNLSGESRFWLYLIASQSGLRAQELDSLTPRSFHLKIYPPYIEVHCTVSKRRTTDRIELSPEFTEMVAVWLRGKPRNQPLWRSSKSWWYKAAEMLRHDLAAAGIENSVMTADGPAVIDFHSFRCYRVTKAILTGKSCRVVLATVRLSSESLLNRYVKMPASEVSECTRSIALPAGIT